MTWKVLMAVKNNNQLLLSLLSWEYEYNYEYYHEYLHWTHQRHRLTKWKSMRGLDIEIIVASSLRRYCITILVWRGKVDAGHWWMVGGCKNKVCCKLLFYERRDRLLVLVLVVSQLCVWLLWLRVPILKRKHHNNYYLITFLNYYFIRNSDNLLTSNEYAPRTWTTTTIIITSETRNEMFYSGCCC